MSAPLREVPIDLLPEYSMKNEVLVELKYRDDSNLVTQKMINKAYNLENFEILKERVSRRECGYYGMTDTWLYQCLFDFPISGKDVLIVGSTAPWYEAICDMFEAKTITVLEYGKRPNFHEKIKYQQETEVADGKKIRRCYVSMEDE